MATIGAVCKMQTNQLFLTLIDLNVYYDPVRIVKSQTSYIKIGDDPGFKKYVTPILELNANQMVRYRSTLNMSRLSTVVLNPRST